MPSPMFPSPERAAPFADPRVVGSVELRPFRAQISFGRRPRALPWAFALRPVGACLAPDLHPSRTRATLRDTLLLTCHQLGLPYPSPSNPTPPNAHLSTVWTRPHWHFLLRGSVWTAAPFTAALSQAPGCCIRLHTASQPHPACAKRCSRHRTPNAGAHCDGALLKGSFPADGDACVLAQSCARDCEPHRS